MEDDKKRYMCVNQKASLNMFSYGTRKEENLQSYILVPLSTS